MTTSDGPAHPVSSLTIRTVDGDVFREWRTPDGELHDGPNGEPAQTEIWPEGNQITRYYTAGVATNGRGGKPATSWFSGDGSFGFERWTDGKLTDGPQGEPARVNVAEDGAIIVERWNDSLRNNGSSGEPAWLELNMDGSVTRSNSPVQGGAESLDLKWVLG
ncbi:hypothetical protein EH165_12380 [Nakamurella antarctica]|uniref:Uncharacterized protein n=1 Tax=Nakamurella antarctica TaxID=1902245 RepID=A0A3G8ZWI9_9ACTN|nr:hypothetical protein [Nakamurella antarctica]AZI58814.1 hypothetical protein EH165_12380 [Nakamurella antarctica]